MAVEAKAPTTKAVATKTTGNAVANAQKTSFKNYIKNGVVMASIESTLGSSARTKTFVASIISAVSTNSMLAKCDNNTIISAALLGESLKLSPSPQLGQFYLVPFKDKDRGDVATFILGWKGYYQLAMRSGAYKKLHAVAIKDGELVKYDPINEEYEFNTIGDPTERKKAKTIGYYAFFETVNGFKKSLYWTREEMEAHAMEFSKGYANDKKRGYSYTFWSKQFDEMALKTMFRQLISKFGVMSIELEKAFVYDTSFSDMQTEDGEEAPPVYFDNPNNGADVMDAETGEVLETKA